MYLVEIVALELSEKLSTALMMGFIVLPLIPERQSGRLFVGQGGFYVMKCKVGDTLGKFAGSFKST